MGKAKLTATVDEVEEVKVDLEKKITAVQFEVTQDFKGQLLDIEQKLKKQILSVQDGVDALDRVKIEEDSCTKIAVQAKRDLEALAVELRKEIEAMCEMFNAEIVSSREAVEIQIRGRAEEAAAHLTETKQELDVVIAEVQSKAADNVEDTRKILAKELVKAREDQAVVDKKQKQELKNALNDIDYRFGDVIKDIEARAVVAAKAVEDSILKAETELAATRAETTVRFEGIDDEIARIHRLFSEVENVPTRKMEWVIRNAETRLLPPKLPKEGDQDYDEYSEEPRYASWKSPVFDAAGARNLQLEFRLFGPEDAVTTGPNKGDCGVLLHAPRGTHIAFKLSIGKVRETFEHKFKREDCMGQEHMCSFKEHIDPNKGTISVGVEILECIFAFDKKNVVADEAAAGNAEGAEAEEQAQDAPLESSFHIQRHVNNRVLDQVQLQLDYFRKRLTRWIEWRLEQASQMKKFFPKGAPMRSHLFDAAGIEGLQLVFYPAGYDSASEGQCSAYLLAPVGATIRCYLQVGAQRRELNHTFEKAGQCGRANFCRFEECFDPAEDAVQVTLQIEEAHLDLVAKFHHPPPAQAGLRSLSKESSSSAIQPFGSTVKLQRSADNLPSVLQEVKVLPSLWASKNYHDLAVKVEGLRPLKEVGKPKRLAGRRSPSNPCLH